MTKWCINEFWHWDNFQTLRLSVTHMVQRDKCYDYPQEHRQRAIFLTSLCHERGMLNLKLDTSRLDGHARLLQASWLRTFQLFLNLFRTRLRYARRDSRGGAPGFGGRGGTNSPMDRIRSKWGRRSSGSVDPSVPEPSSCGTTFFPVCSVLRYVDSFCCGHAACGLRSLKHTSAKCAGFYKYNLITPKQIWTWMCVSQT